MRRGRCRERGSAPGFTLIELLIVVAIVAIIVSLALPHYGPARRRAQEAVLKENLWILRDVIDQFYADKGTYPPSLESLVTEGYLREIPVDPMTESASTWETVDVSQGGEGFDDADFEQGGIYDVHSGSPDQALDGSYYRDW